MERERALALIEGVVRQDDDWEAYGALPTSPATKFMAMSVLEATDMEPEVWGRYDGGISMDWDMGAEFFDVLVDAEGNLFSSSYSPEDALVRLDRPTTIGEIQRALMEMTLRKIE